MTSHVSSPPVEPPQSRREGATSYELVIDKLVDFILIFVGLYAATSLQRCQDSQKEKAAYVTLLRDFKRELKANMEQEEAIEKDLGPIDETEPGANLGPMQVTFTQFFKQLAEDERLVKCLHDEFATVGGHGNEVCHTLYTRFDEAHAESNDSFSFKPAVLTPFYRYEVWELYMADGIKTFRNKDLAVKIAEVYANARLIEKQVADIEATYNDAFMKQVSRTAATDMELAEIVHDEEQHHGLSDHDRKLLLHVDEAIKEEHYASLEVKQILELKVERMKNIVLVMREEIDSVREAIDDELVRVGRAEEP